MENRFKRLPSPSMAVAFIALLAALGGTAVALPGKNGVKSDDIAKNAVRSSDIKSSNVGSSDVKNNALTGSDINEARLSKVPSAAVADAANTANTAGSANTANSANTAGSAGSVNGRSLSRIRYADLNSGAAVPIFSAGGLTITADCNAGDVDLDAVSATNDATINVKVLESDATSDSDSLAELDANAPHDFDAGTDNAQYFVMYKGDDSGPVVTAQFSELILANAATGTGGQDCFVWGEGSAGS